MLCLNNEIIELDPAVWAAGRRNTLVLQLLSVSFPRRRKSTKKTINSVNVISCVNQRFLKKLAHCVKG